MTMEKSDRRFLIFPAITPCKDISQVTLLQSLIELASNICSYKSKIFVCSKRNARETIRQIENLLIVLEEIRHRRLVLPNSRVLCFVELHLAFQKIQFLLEDCTRNGARLWILMRSEYVATKFQIFIRLIATALDVLPLDSIDVSIEVRELVQLVSKQSQRVSFEVSRYDELVMKDVLSILNQFKNRVVPESIALRRVLDHLKIGSWSECNEEIHFLNDEISLESLKGSDKMVDLLSSLVGFMTYCRCVVFDVVDNKKTNQSDYGCDMESFKCFSPKDFWCPISLEIMNDPVTTATGQTYDRASIQKWLNNGNRICPKTLEIATNKELLPNLALKKLIWKFCYSNNIPIGEPVNTNRDVTSSNFTFSPAATEAMRMLVEFLCYNLVIGTVAERKKAAYEISLLTKSSIFNSSCLEGLFMITRVLCPVASIYPSIQANVIVALLNLSKHLKSKAVIVKNGGLNLIMKVLTKGLDMETQELAALVLFNLTSVEEYSKLIGEIPEAIPSLVELIKYGTNRGKENAVNAIFGLLYSSGNHNRVLEIGTVPLLVNILKHSKREEELMTVCLSVLAILAEKPGGTVEILNSSAIPLLVEILQSSTAKEKEHCVSVLLSICKNRDKIMISVLANIPMLMHSLYSLLTEGFPHGRRKARLLLRILHGFHDN